MWISFTFGLPIQWAAVIACLVEIKAAPQDGITRLNWSTHKPNIQGYGFFSQFTFRELTIWLDLDRVVLKALEVSLLFQPHLESMVADNMMSLFKKIGDLSDRFFRVLSNSWMRSEVQDNWRQQAESVRLGHRPIKIPFEAKHDSGRTQTPWSLLGLTHLTTWALWTPCKSTDSTKLDKITNVIVFEDLKNAEFGYWSWTELLTRMNQSDSIYEHAKPLVITENYRALFTV